MVDVGLKILRNYGQYCGDKVFPFSKRRTIDSDGMKTKSISLIWNTTESNRTIVQDHAFWEICNGTSTVALDGLPEATPTSESKVT
jgi:hypothetical protein